MAYTLEDVAKIERAIASGRTRITLDGRTVVYQDLTAMRRARQEMLDEIAASSASPKRKRVIRFTQTGSGY